MEKYNLESLNEEQKNALFQTDGHILVTAGAGSGKTRLLTHRICYLVKEKGVRPYNILAITFTNKAANEMRNRVLEMIDDASELWISTFHSMCVRILRSKINLLEGYSGSFSIYSEQDKEKLVKDILTEVGITDEEFKKRLMFHISNWKNKFISLDDYINMYNYEYEIDKIKNYIIAYENKLKNNNALDFDDLLIKTHELFSNHKEALEAYANRFQYILVDEFQDTNGVQYELVKMLSSVHNNLFVVGDEDQCIYSWRGANFENIFKFKDDFNDTKVFKLERNYRSTARILELANNVIKNNKERLDKKLWTDKDSGSEPEIYNAYDEREEANFVAKKINELVTQGYKYSDFAILMRLNALSRSFEEALLNYNIPYKVFGGFKFFERLEIKNIISYLRLFVNPQDDVSFLRIVNFPKRGIGEGAIKKLKEVSKDRDLLTTTLDCANFEDKALCKKFQEFTDIFVDVLKDYEQTPLDEFVKEIIDKFKIRSAYNSGSEEDTNRLYNIDGFLASVKEYYEKNPLSTLNDYLETITLISDIDDIQEDNSVSVATIHSVKGLEFKVVFIVGLEETFFPIGRALNSKSDMEEERRLMYVAITRAEEKLFMSACSKRYLYGQTKYMLESRFIGELGLKKSKGLFEVKPKESVYDKYQIIGARKVSYCEPVNTYDKNKYEIGQKVKHPKFGEGEIIKFSDDRLVVDIDFEGFGVKSLMTEIAPLTIIGGKDD